MYINVAIIELKRNIYLFRKKKNEIFTEYSILNRLEVGVFDRAVNLDSPCTCKVHSKVD
jgi:hypothetical protein